VKFLKIVGVVLALLILAALALPLLINGNQFRPVLEERLTAALGREVKIGDLKLSLFSGGASASDVSIAAVQVQNATERVQAALAMRRAADGEFLPTVRVNADYGAVGNSPSNAAQTYSVAGTVNVPIFQGAKRHGRVLEADATVRMRQAEADSLKSAIAYELRTILLDVSAAQEQLTVAMQARDLAAQQLGQARDRLSAGVGNSIEVVQAQEAVTLASEQYIAALYGLTTAKAGLVRGLGSTEETAKKILGGVR